MIVGLVVEIVGLIGIIAVVVWVIFCRRRRQVAEDEPIVRFEDTWLPALLARQLTRGVPIWIRRYWWTIGQSWVPSSLCCKFRSCAFPLRSASGMVRLMAP